MTVETLRATKNASYIHLAFSLFFCPFFLVFRFSLLFYFSQKKIEPRDLDLRPSWKLLQPLECFISSETRGLNSWPWVDQTH